MSLNDRLVLSLKPTGGGQKRIDRCVWFLNGGGIK